MSRIVHRQCTAKQITAENAGAPTNVNNSFFSMDGLQGQTSAIAV